MRIAILFLLLIFSIPSLAQKNAIICGEVSSQQDFIINIYPPINGYYNSPQIDTTKINSALINEKDSIYKSIKLKEPSFIHIVFKNSKKEFIHSTDVLLFPGDSLNLHCDLSVDNPSWVKYNGSNASGQQIFNEINYIRYTKFIPITHALNDLPGNKQSFIEEVHDCVNKNIERFKALKSVSPQFIQTMEVCLKMTFYGEVINKFTGGFRQSEVLSKEEKNAIIDKLIAEISNTTIDIRGLYNSNLYINGYFNYLAYKKYNLNSIAELSSSNKVYSKNGRQYDIDKDLAALIDIDDKKIQEDLWAFNILNYISIIPGIFDQTVIDQYCSIFPDNKWEKLLRTQLYIYSKKTVISYKLQSPILYIDTTKDIKTFDSLLKELPSGSPIFVDCWATWCGPCIGAFAYNKPLDSLLLANNIERLYISIDNPINRAIWKKSIDKYSLGGYHILADNDLITDIKKICAIPDPKRSPIMIPRYLLVNKKGIVVINDANSPHDFELLKNQIISSVLAP